MEAAGLLFAAAKSVGREQDADLYASWGVDLLKYDLCSLHKEMGVLAPGDKIKQNAIMFLESMPAIGYAPDGTPSTVEIDNPTGNEQRQYPISSAPETKTAYCVIVSLPNPTNTGSTLILAGTDSQATEAGGDFITSEEGLEPLRTLLHQKTFPHFQALLRISSCSGTPLSSEILSYRLIK